AAAARYRRQLAFARRRPAQVSNGVACAMGDCRHSSVGGTVGALAGCFTPARPGFDAAAPRPGPRRILRSHYGTGGDSLTGRHPSGIRFAGPEWNAEAFDSQVGRGKDNHTSEDRGRDDSVLFPGRAVGWFLRARKTEKDAY